MVSDSFPDFEEAALALATAEPIRLELTAYEAYVMTAFLQFGARLLGDDHESTGFARAIAVAVGQRLVEVCPMTASSIAAGWHPEWDIETSLDYWAKLTEESPLHEVFGSGQVPIEHSFTITSEAVGPHYIVDARRLAPGEPESLALYLKKLWNVDDSAKVEQITADISKGLPVKAEHFTGEIVTTPKETA